MSETLTDAQIVEIATKAHAEDRLSWLGFEKDSEGRYTIPVLSQSDFQLVRAVLAALERPQTQQGEALTDRAAFVDWACDEFKTVHSKGEGFKEREVQAAWLAWRQRGARGDAAQPWPRALLNNERPLSAPQQAGTGEPVGGALTDEQRLDLLTASFCVAGVGDPTATLKPEAAERIIELLGALAATPGASLVRLTKSDVLPVLAKVDQGVSVPAPDAQEVAAVIVNLGGDGAEHHQQAAGSALPHGADGTPHAATTSASVQAEPVISMKLSEWTALSPEAQAKLQSIVTKGSREQHLAQAQAAQDMRSKPLLSQAATPESAPASVQDDTAAEWRRLALQFDGHRMQAMGLIRFAIRSLAKNGIYNDLRARLETFSAAPPMDGEVVLAERLAALAAWPTTSNVLAAWEVIEQAVANIPEGLEGYLDDFSEAMDSARVVFKALEARAYPSPVLPAPEAGKPVAPVAQPVAEYYCNKCGYFGPVQWPHNRRNGTECGYLAVATATPSDGAQASHPSPAANGAAEPSDEQLDSIASNHAASWYQPQGAIGCWMISQEKFREAARAVLDFSTEKKESP